MTTALVWFRNDLRMLDNPALRAAAATGKPVIGAYIHETAGRRQPGGASKWYLEQCLTSLQKDLQTQNVPLLFIKGKSEEMELLKLRNEYRVSNVFWNRRYDPADMSKDEKIEKALKKEGCDVKTFQEYLLFEPWTIKSGTGNYYKVYTPFWKACLKKQPKPRAPVLEPIEFQHQSDLPEMKEETSVKDLKLVPMTAEWPTKLANYWGQISESTANVQLTDFCQKRLRKYQDSRDLPAVKGTSQLAAYLHFGVISPYQCWHAAAEHCKNSISKERWLSQLGWREFSYHLLYHNPDFSWKNFNPKFDRLEWAQDHPHLEDWQQGRTGIPIVDAGMRELWETGFMHNRVRMIVGSFLTKHMGVHWRRGEEWFWDTLVDADVANNAMGWQWVAGSGADASPYFRIFNPVLQSKKFDPDGKYIRKWCPELKGLDAKQIHEPWEVSASALRQSGIVLGREYPKPILDLKEGRQHALDLYEKTKN
jgi:deoxyribodipyrimidine photo-lyase